MLVITAVIITPVQVKNCPVLDWHTRRICLFDPFSVGLAALVSPGAVAGEDDHNDALISTESMA